MERFKFRYSYGDLDMSVDKIGRLIDYHRGNDQDIIAGIIEEVLGEAEGICDIRAEYSIFNNIYSDKESDVLVVNNTRFEVGKIVKAPLKRAGSVAVFLCTAGRGIGEQAQSLIAGKDFLRGYIFDVAGSVIVDAAMDLVQTELGERMAKEGLKITNRYSPGYCGWHVSEQHKLFSLVPGNSCNITLNEASLMSPIKSVSGFIGIGENVRFNPYTCSACDMLSCIYRKKKPGE
jgi:hypothetical protein